MRRPLFAGAALAVAGPLASELGDIDRARPLYEASPPLAVEAGDRPTEAWALHGLGFVSAREGDRATARELLERSHALFLELGQHAPAAGRLTHLAYLARLDGDLEAARRYSEDSIYRELYESLLGELDPEDLAAGGAASTDEVAALAQAVASRASGS
jgi:hypothetical protein